MPQLAVCPQRHIWLAEANLAEDSPQPRLICPACGLPGQVANGVLTSAQPVDETKVGNAPGSIAETLAPHLVPPVADSHAGESTWSASNASRFAGYELLCELGRGGMGVVYLARDRSLKRLVALKMILAGLHADSGTRERFHREAEAVARLQHPGIVQIHEVNESDGRPYLSLEYVDGNNLGKHLDARPINALGAARLMESLARTIHYAHKKGIIHRDLSPRNILLSRSTSNQGIRLGATDAQIYEPKITDFGLAKELDGGIQNTQTGDVLGTPSYMSPEQAQGRIDIVGPASDIYSLGAILYESLTGRPPFVAGSRLDTLRQVLEMDPIPPSRLQPQIPRDVETICLKCLEKDPIRRYETAEHLADDVSRFLNNQPILARPASRWERTGKWIRRHPAVATAASIAVMAVLALAAGGVLYNVRIRIERDRAEANLGLALRAVDEMLTEVGSERLATEPRMEETRRVLLQQALVLYQELLQQRRSDPRMRYETALAYRRLADVLRLLERHTESLDAYARAIAMLEPLQAETANRPDLKKQLADCHNFRGEVYRAIGLHVEAEREYRQAFQFLDQLLAASPTDPAFRQDQARTLYNIGILFREMQRGREAEESLRRAMDVLEKLVKQFPQEHSHQQHLARASLNLGTVIRASQRYEEAQRAYQTAIDLLGPLAEQQRENPDYRHELGVTYNNLGNLWADMDRTEDALSAHEKAAGFFQTLSTEFPRIPVYRQELANAHNSIGSVHDLREQYAAAAKSWDTSAELLEVLLAEQPDRLAYHADLAMVRGNLGLAYHALHDWDRAREQLELAVDQLNRAIEQGGGDQNFFKQLRRDQYQNLAEVLIQAKNHSAAAAAARMLASIASASPLDMYHAACFLSRCASVARDTADLAPEQRQTLVAAYGDESLALLRQAIRSGFSDTARLKNDEHEALVEVASRDDFRQLVDSLGSHVPVTQ